MPAHILAAFALLGAGFYASRLIPRAMARMSSTAAASSATGATFRKAGMASFSREAHKAFEYPFLREMTRKEALLILGFDPETQSAPSAAEIKSQFRSLLIHFHSDVGGSPEVAKKIIAAHELLTKNR